MSPDNRQWWQRLTEQQRLTASNWDPTVQLIKAPVTSNLVVAFMKQVRGWVELRDRRAVSSIHSVQIWWRGGAIFPNTGRRAWWLRDVQRNCGRLLKQATGRT